MPKRSWASAAARAAGRALVAVLLLGLGGCGDTSADPDPGAELTVYVSMPTRGGFADHGRDAADGARLALAEAEGEAAGYAVRARFLDDTAEMRFAGTSIGGAPSPVKAAENARRATEDSTAIAYIGELTSGGTRASLPVTNEAMLLHVSPGAGATDLVAEFAGSDEVPPTQPSGERNFGRVVPSDFAQGEAAARWAKQLGWRWVGIVDDGTAFGATLASGFEEEAAELGIAVGSEDAPRLFLTGRERAGDTPAIASDSFLPPYRFGLPSPVRVISAALDPVHLPPRGRELAARFEAEYGRRPGRYAAYGYEAMAVILDSIERAADPADRSAVIDAFFETASRDSVLGRYSISEIGETTLARMTGYLPGEEGRPRPVAELTAGP